MSTAARVRLADIATCFEGIIPSPICTCSADRVPNVTYLSIVHLIDETHVALSVQFFNKTRRNILENPRAQVLLVEPDTMMQYRLDILFERTETAGPLFDRVCTRLEAIASQSGMRDVFRLRGVDIYEVLDCRPVSGESTATADDSRLAVARLADLSLKLSSCADLDSLITTALEQLAATFGYGHAFIMVRSEDGSRLYTLASHGFPLSGVGSEVAIGDGLIGTAAARRLPVRSTNLMRERVMTRAVREEMRRAGDAGRLEEEIPLPGLPNAQSQLVLPLEARGQLLGVLCLQSDIAGRFLAADESWMQILARQLSASMIVAGFGATANNATVSVESPARASGETEVRYYPADDSVFINDEYVIKGVAGRILYKMLQLHVEQKRDEFTNKEMRLDPALRLPDYQDNLEARLILLRRRLEDRTPIVRLTRVGRGRLRLSLSQPIRLRVG
jgi:adenylate cyclase